MLATVYCDSSSSWRFALNYLYLIYANLLVLANIPTTQFRGCVTVLLGRVSRTLGSPTTKYFKILLTVILLTVILLTVILLTVILLSCYFFWCR